MDDEFIAAVARSWFLLGLLIGAFVGLIASTVLPV